MFRIEHNAETGEIIEIPLTEDEIKDIEKRKAEAAPKIAAFEMEKAEYLANRQAVLDKLGLSVEDLKALGL